MSLLHVRSSDVIDAGDSAMSDEYSPAAAGEWTDDEEQGGVTMAAGSVPHHSQHQQTTADPVAGSAPAPTDASGKHARRHHRHRKHRRSRASGSEADSEEESGDDQRSVRRRPPPPRDSCCVRWLGANSGVLWLFTLCQMMIFYDRGMVAGFLPSIQQGLGPESLSDTQMGLLGSGFIFGYMLACPLFAFFSKSYSPYKLMAIGLFLWINAVLLCGLTDNFMTLLGARILTGVGEASFAGLAPTCIDDVAPMAHRTIWLSFFFSGIPIGSALGYIAGGWFAGGFGWHWGFLTESVAMVPIMFVVFFWPNHIDDSDETPPATAALAVDSEAEEAAAAARAAHRSHRRRHSQRLHAEPPTDSAFYDQTATPVPAQDVVAPLEQLPQYPRAHPASNISRSISTPALKRLDALNLQQQHAGAAETMDTESFEQEHTSFDADDATLGGQLLHDERKFVPASPSYANASPAPALVLSVPSSPAPRSYSNSHGAHPYAQSHSRGSRTPGLRVEQPYIVPDPLNPYHAPGRGQHYRESVYAVATPGPRQWGGAGGDRPPPIDPMASLPSPGSFNPHYAVQLGEASRNEEAFVTDVVALLTDGVYIFVVLGYAALAFVIGALSFWAPVDFSKTLHISISRSTQIIGVITFCCGLGGTFFGGWCMDYRGGGKGIFAVISALELSCVFVTVSIGFALASVLTLDLTTSMVCLALADFFLFGTGAPINAALLSVAPRNMRSLAMAMSILLMHALGDLPSPFLMGYITDQVSSIRLALVILILWLLWTVLFWCLGVKLARKRAQQFKEQLSKEMGRHPNERSALLLRRGSTGQFYSGADARAGGGAAAGRGQRGVYQPRPQQSGPHARSHHSGSLSGSSTPTSGHNHAGRYPHRARSSSQTPQQQPQQQQQQHRRGPSYGSGHTSPCPHAHRSLQQQRSTSPAVGSRALQLPFESNSSSTGQGGGFVALPVYDASGNIVAYTQAPAASQLADEAVQTSDTSDTAAAAEFKQQSESL